MGDFFSATKQVTVDLEDDSPISFTALLAFGIPESIVSCIQPMQDYTVAETIEEVGLDPFSLWFLSL